MNNAESKGTIQRLNDQLRRTGEGGRIMMTDGIQRLGSGPLGDILQSIRTFTAFNEDNDPHGEHDFGSLKVGGVLIFWKIDYYNQTLEAHSENAADTKLTRRVLTIMLAEEY